MSILDYRRELEELDDIADILEKIAFELMQYYGSTKSEELNTKH